MIVDFLVTDSKPGVQSDLLVTAIPKVSLAPKLEACNRGGLEATEAELDGAALFDVARQAGLMGPDSAQVFVCVGDVSTTVVVADDGRLVSMRAIRAGAQPPDAPPPLDEPEEDEESSETADDPLESAPANEPVDPARLERTIQSIRRELGRTISGARTANPIEAVYMCGRELPGFIGEEIFDVPVSKLEGLPEDSDVADPAELVVAYGTALHQLGGGTLRSHLRREDLRFTGKFERVELPLAVFSLLLVTLLAVMFIVVRQEIQWRERDLRTWLLASQNFVMPKTSGSEVRPGRLRSPPQDLKDYDRTVQDDLDAERTPWQQISHVREILMDEMVSLQSQLGQSRDFPQPLSALRGATLILCTIDDLGEQVGRVAIRSLEADYVMGRAGKPDKVRVKMDIDFLAENDLAATQHRANLIEAIEAAPWCLEFEDKATKVIEGGLGITVDGMTIYVDSQAVEETAP